MISRHSTSTANISAVPAMRQDAAIAVLLGGVEPATEPRDGRY